MTTLMVLQVVAVVLLSATAFFAIVTAGIKVAEKMLKDKDGKK